MQVAQHLGTKQGRTHSADAAVLLALGGWDEGATVDSPRFHIIVPKKLLNKLLPRCCSARRLRKGQDYSQPLTEALSACRQAVNVAVQDMVAMHSSHPQLASHPFCRVLMDSSHWQGLQNSFRAASAAAQQASLQPAESSANSAPAGPQEEQLSQQEPEQAAEAQPLPSELQLAGMQTAAHAPEQAAEAQQPPAKRRQAGKAAKPPATPSMEDSAKSASPQRHQQLASLRGQLAASKAEVASLQPEQAARQAAEEQLAASQAENAGLWTALILAEADRGRYQRQRNKWRAKCRRAEGR